MRSANTPAPTRIHSRFTASLMMLGVAAAIGLWPTAAESKQSSAAAGFTPITAHMTATATVADGGGTGPDTPPPPIPGVAPMDAQSHWVFPIREAHQMAGTSSWTLDQGVDLGFGVGFSRSFCGSKATLVAVDDGVITKVGLNGFGSKSPVLKITEGPYKGRQVYYGHSQPTVVHVGQVVKRGQAISHIGCGIVGLSSAPHLEFGLFNKGQVYCCPSRGETSDEVMSILRRMFPTAVAAAKKRK